MDLSLEGPAAKVSRKQATIRLRNSGDFFMSSEGKRPIFVDGRPVLQGNKVKLNHNSVIEVLLSTLKKYHGLVVIDINYRGTDCIITRKVVFKSSHVRFPRIPPTKTFGNNSFIMIYL